MRGKALPDEKLGKATLRIVMDGSVYRGVVIRDGKPGEPVDDPDLQRLRHRLREEAGRSDPSYWGYDGAIARFLSFNPLGFSDPSYLADERAYKVEASDWLRERLPLQRAAEATAEDAAELSRIVGMTNLLAHQHEQQHLRDLLRGSQGSAFVKASAEVAQGETEGGLKREVTPERPREAIIRPIVLCRRCSIAPSIQCSRRLKLKGA